MNPDPNDRGWRGAPLHWQIAHVVGIALPAQIFWFAPNDVLTRFPALASITGMMKEWIPSVRKMAEFSNFPQVAELGMSSIFVCALLLVAVFYYGKTVVRSRRAGFTIPDTKKEVRLLNFLALLLGPIALLGLLTLGPDTPTEAAELLKHQGGKISRMTKGYFLDNRMGGGIMASIYAFALAALIVGIEIQYIVYLKDKAKGK
jgi:hypothetical protein